MNDESEFRDMETQEDGSVPRLYAGVVPDVTRPQVWKSSGAM